MRREHIFIEVLEMPHETDAFAAGKSRGICLLRYG